MDGTATPVGVTDSLMLTRGEAPADDMVGIVALSLREVICVVVGTGLDELAIVIPSVEETPGDVVGREREELAIVVL